MKTMTDGDGWWIHESSLDQYTNRRRELLEVASRLHAQLPDQLRNWSPEASVEEAANLIAAVNRRLEVDR